MKISYFLIILALVFISSNSNAAAEDNSKHTIFSYHLYTSKFERKVNDLTDIKINAYKDIIDIELTYEGKEGVRIKKEIAEGWEVLLSSLPIQGVGDITIKNSFAVNDDIRFSITEKIVILKEGKPLNITSVDGHLTPESAGILDLMRKGLLKSIHASLDSVDIDGIIKDQIKNDEYIINKVNEIMDQQKQ